MKKRYPPDRKLTLTCQSCPPGLSSRFHIHLEQTQAQVPSPYEDRKGKLDRWTLIKLECSRCGFISQVGMGLSEGCGWEKLLLKEGVRRKDPKKRILV